MRRKLIYLIAVWALCLQLLITGCSSKSTPTPEARPDSLQNATNPAIPRRGGRIIVGVQQEPEMLNEILNSMATNIMICNLIFSKFVKYDDSLNLVPDVIEEIPSLDNGGISPDYLTYTYSLRKDVYWHDGKPLTSRDVLFTYRAIMDPRVNVESREGWDAIASVETPDDKTVVFHLKKPYPDFAGEAFYDESILPEHILKNDVGENFQSSEFNHKPVGSGPFKFNEWVPGSHISLVRNDDYYGEGPYLDEIIFKFIPDANTLLVQLKTGEIDWFDNADVNFVSQLEKIPGMKIYKTPMMMYEHLDLNMENPILKDKRVRQALAYATNKKEIAEKIYNGLVTVAELDEFPASKYFCKKAARKTEYNPVLAESLLREAGWADVDEDGILEKDGEELKLTISTTSGRINRERTELVLMDQYKKLGIKLKIRNYNPTVMYGSFDDGGILKRGKFDIAMYAWLSSPEPATKEALYSMNNIPPNGQNHPRIRNQELTTLLELGSGEVEVARRKAIYDRVAQILVDEVPVIPLFWYTSLDVCRSDLKNFRPNPTQSADTWNANQWYLAERGELQAAR